MLSFTRDVVWGGGRGAFEGACVDWRIRATGEETERALVANPAAWLIPRWGVRVQYLQPQLDLCKVSSIMSHTAWSTNSGTERKRLTRVEPALKAIVRSNGLHLLEGTYRRDTCPLWDCLVGLCNVRTFYSPPATTPGYTSGQLSTSVPNSGHGSRPRIALTWEPNLLRHQPPETLPPPNTLWVVEFQGMHVIDLAIPVNNSPRI